MSKQLSYFFEKTSRTFALCIPILPQPIRNQVALAYLLFRVVDTFEDAYDWPPYKRIEALQTFMMLVDRQAKPEAFSHLDHIYHLPTTNHEGYIELLQETPWLIEELYALPASTQQIIWSHLKRTIEGMIHFLETCDDQWQVHLKSLAELELYCYTVAGIVGEMLTELFLSGTKDKSAHMLRLLTLSSSLGNGLQLTNILKDESDDHSEGSRLFLHKQPSRKSKPLGQERRFLGQKLQIFLFWRCRKSRLCSFHQSSIRRSAMAFDCF